MSGTAPPVLDIRGLTIALPSGADRALAVDRAGFSVNASEIVCLVGESGSGKSVIAQATMGLLPAALRAAGGQVLVDRKTFAKVEEMVESSAVGPLILKGLSHPIAAFSVGRLTGP